MRICHVIQHSCVRVHKLAAAQAAAGHTCYLINRTFSPHHPFWQYKAVFRTFEYDGHIMLDQWREACRLIDDKVDLFHIHNEPNFLVPEFRQWTDKPIVYDIHDLTSLRGKPEPDEDRSLEMCDGVCTVSEGYVDLIRKKTQKPIHLYYSSNPLSWIDAIRRSEDRTPGLIYTGQIGGELPYRQWGEVLCQLEDLDVPITIIASDANQFLKLPRPLRKTYIQRPMHIFFMMGAIARHDAHLVGFPVVHPLATATMPNKLWDSLAAWTPVICLNSQGMETFIREEGVGLVVSRVSEIPDAWAAIRGNPVYRENARMCALKYSMDRQVPDLERFYMQLIDGRTQGVLSLGSGRREDRPPVG